MTRLVSDRRGDRLRRKAGAAHRGPANGREPGRVTRHVGDARHAAADVANRGSAQRRTRHATQARTGPHTQHALQPTRASGIVSASG